MKWLPVLLLLILPGCDRGRAKPESLQLTLLVTNGSVRLGNDSLPSDSDALSEYIVSLAPEKDATREVDLVFAGDTSPARMIEMFNAVLLCGGYTEDYRIPFNIAGRSGKPFRLDVSDVFCCGSKKFVSAQESVEPGADLPWVEMALSFEDEMFTLDGEAMDRDQLSSRLKEPGPACLGILVMINAKQKDTAASLAPVIEICESAGASVILSCEEQEEEDLHLRRLRSRMMMPSLVIAPAPVLFRALPVTEHRFAEEILE